MIAFIDVETDGLIAEGGHLLEVACMLTDEEYVPVETYQAVVQYSQTEVGEMLTSASLVVVSMHSKTGLWSRLTGPDAKPLSQIDAELSTLIAKHGLRPPPIAGNSVALDQNFVRVHLPQTYAELDYHMRDVSTIAAFAQESFGIEPFVKTQAHTAMFDIVECVAELIYYREAIRAELGKSAQEVFSKGVAFHRRAIIAESAIREAKDILSPSQRTNEEQMAFSILNEVPLP